MKRIIVSATVHFQHLMTVQLTQRRKERRAKPPRTLREKLFPTHEKIMFGIGWPEIVVLVFIAAIPLAIVIGVVVAFVSMSRRK